MSYARHRALQIVANVRKAGPDQRPLELRNFAHVDRAPGAARDSAANRRVSLAEEGSVNHADARLAIDRQRN